MNKLILCISGLLVANALEAQTLQKPNGILYPNGVYYSQCSNFEISRPLRELAAENPVTATDRFDRKEVDKPRTFKAKGNPTASIGPDPVAQTSMGVLSMSQPGSNWTGQTGGGYPLDPTGGAGPTAYVQAVNTYYQAFDKVTGAPLMASMSLKSLWPGSIDDGDPIALYDKYADRWFIQQFQVSNNTQKILIAISATNDPTGAYYKYTFIPDASDSPDYPKFSIWSDGYYMTANWNNQKVTVFDRVKMLAGNATAGMIVKPVTVNLPNNGFFAPMPADADGELPPGGTPMSIFAFEDDNWGAPAVKDQIHVLKMTTDWTTPANTTLIEDVAGGSPIATSPFNSYWSNYMNEVAQKSSSQRLDAIQGVFMFRAQYRRWAGYNSVVLNNAVNLDTITGHCGIRWYELRQNVGSGIWTIYQQGTYAPDAENRWMGSIAMDDNGAIGMGFAISGNVNFPSLAYTGRNANDPLGQMTYSEIIAKSGTTSQAGINRWGDYGHTSLDPDGLTFWHTGMFEDGNGPESQIFNFAINGLAGIQEPAKPLSHYLCYQSNPASLIVNGSDLESNEQIVVDLFDIEGRQIYTSQVVPAGNGFQTTIPVSGLATGTYMVRIGNVHFQKVVKVSLN